MLVSQRVYRVNLYIFSSPSSETMKLLSSHTFYHRSKASHNSRFPSSHSFEQLKTPHKCHWSTEKTSERSGIWNIISGIQVCPPRLRRITCSLFSTPPSLDQPHPPSNNTIVAPTARLRDSSIARLRVARTSRALELWAARLWSIRRWCRSGGARGAHRRAAASCPARGAWETSRVGLLPESALAK